MEGWGVVHGEEKRIYQFMHYFSKGIKEGFCCLSSHCATQKQHREHWPINAETPGRAKNSNQMTLIIPIFIRFIGECHVKVKRGVLQELSCPGALFNSVREIFSRLLLSPVTIVSRS